MIQDIIRHKLDYCILAVFSAIFIVFFLSYQHNPSLLLVGTIIYGVIYVIWGVLHHLRTSSLHGRVVLEYLLVSMFAILLVATLLI